MSYRNEWLLIKTEYLKITYFQALGYVKLDIICCYLLPSFLCDPVLNTVVLRLCLIFICIMCVHMCVCVCVCVCTHKYNTLQEIPTSSAHNWDKHRSNTF